MPRPQPTPLPTAKQLNRAHARLLDRTFNDALVYHLTHGCDLVAARSLAMDAKVRAFAQLIDKGATR